MIQFGSAFLALLTLLFINILPLHASNIALDEITESQASVANLTAASEFNGSFDKSGSFNIGDFKFEPEVHFLRHLASQVTLPQDYKKIVVENSSQLYDAISMANQFGKTAILIVTGHYSLSNTLQITNDHIMLIGTGNTPFDIVLTGNGMQPTSEVDNLVRVTGNYFTIDNLTLEQAGNHLIQFASKSGASHPVVQNVVFQDAYEQLLKVSFDKSKPTRFSADGIVRNCLFRYTKGVGPNWYIGGIDAHGVQNWQISNNVFLNIASPGEHIAEHAIHLWNSSKHNFISRNIIIDSDRAIGLGMRNTNKPTYHYSNLAGEISDNVILHQNNKDPFADVAIILEDSPETRIVNNVIYMEHRYENAIEVRFRRSSKAYVTGNVANKSIIKRNGGEGYFLSNKTLDLASVLDAVKIKISKLNAAKPFWVE